ncbi:hypothetical protein IFR04_006546 [Cadophora malorum]|uniref:Ankyrin n=1 Tax=Cadophora malorum TaxID=108018 RepID=A0A8H7W7S8_9HELO|nr:hypothetical protein IFR04_006546 [Cadophora malorum]
MLYRLLENQQSAAIDSNRIVEETDSDDLQQTLAVYPDPVVTLRNLRQKIESRYACDPNCLCACHIPFQAGISTKWTGSLAISDEDANRQTPFSIAWEIYTKTNVQETKQLTPKLFPNHSDDERCNLRMSKLQLVICELLPGDIGEEIELSKNGIDYQDSVGNTALHWAIECRNPDVVKTLLSHGADPALPDFRDAGADINARDNRGKTPLNFVCMKDDRVANIEYLTQRGADINLIDFDGLSPMDSAIQWENASNVKILLESGADCCGTTADGSNILHFVAHWVSGEWAETFDELLTAILEVQDGATDESDELYGEEGITTDGEEDSQDDWTKGSPR